MARHPHLSFVAPEAYKRSSFAVKWHNHSRRALFEEQLKAIVGDTRDHEMIAREWLGNTPLGPIWQRSSSCIFSLELLRDMPPLYRC